MAADGWDNDFLVQSQLGFCLESVGQVDAGISYLRKRRKFELESRVMVPSENAPGNVTFNAATRELTIAAMPDHASYIRAYRMPAGGTTVTAGVSSTPTVSVVGLTPLTPGVNYVAWVVGVNSRGEGPGSNTISFTA